MSTLVLMVCNLCGAIDSGPDGSMYECPKCGSGDGWGAENQSEAEYLSERVRAQREGQQA